MDNPNEEIKTDVSGPETTNDDSKFVNNEYEEIILGPFL